MREILSHITGPMVLGVIAAVFAAGSALWSSIQQGQGATYALPFALQVSLQALCMLVSVSNRHCNL